MTSVIKATAANGSVRPFVAPARLLIAPGEQDGGFAPVDGELTLAREDKEKDALRREIVTLKLALEAADEAKAESEHRARQEERQAARKAREADAEVGAERLARLTASLDRMGGAWDRRLASLDGLAALVARASLSKLFDSWDEASEFVMRTIARQVRLVRREAIASIRVSGDDFPDQDALDALAARAGSGSIRIIADPDMAAGECRADLQLGHIDLGASAQRSELAALLETLAETNEDAQ